MRERIRQRDGRAERVADDRRTPDAHRVQEAVERARGIREAVACRWLRRASEAREVDGEHRRDAGQRRDVVAPGFRESAESVQEDYDGATAFGHVVDREAVDFRAAELHVRHGAGFYQRRCGAGGASATG